MFIRILSTLRTVGILAIGLFAGSTAGCSGCGDDATANPDGGVQPSVRLRVVSAESLGLSFGQSATLSVQYVHDTGEVISGAKIEFAILDSQTGDPAGSTISATAADTDNQGVAVVELTAGAARANFRVEASADDADAVYFYVSVSQDGFASLEVRPRHLGPRDAADYARTELRLYRSTTVTCATFDVDGELTSVFPPLATDGFDGSSVEFANVSVGMNYTLVGWALVAGTSTRLAKGCVDLPNSVIAPGPRQLDLAMTDRRPALPSSIRLASSFLLAPLATELAQSAALSPWTTMACPAGPGQLLLDCTLDALETDGTLDCVVTAGTARIITAQAARGPADGNGCRPLQDGGDTLDAELLAAIETGALFPTGLALDQLLAARADTTELLELSSVLEFDAALGRQDSGTLAHRLDTATITIAGTRVSELLADTARPVVTAAPVSWTADQQGTLLISEHGFTLRLGTLAQAGFREVGLASMGLDARADDLGAAMAESASDTATTTTGCDAVSAVLCTRLGESIDCAQAACAAATSYLDGAMNAWWQHLDGASIDFRLAGSAALRDDDDDLQADSLGVSSQGQDGGWTASFRTRDGDDVGTSGSFGSTMVQSGP